MGQKADSKDLGDATIEGTSTPNWDKDLLKDLHGLILISGDRPETVDDKLSEIKGIFGVGSPYASIEEVTSLVGKVRPGDQEKHEQYVFILPISGPTF